MNFIHASDFHLGYAQYGLHERFKDYAIAFQSVIHYAIDHKAEFILISGDLFHKRNINAPTYEQAYKVLSELRVKSPSTKVYAIEGNHDLALHLDGKGWLEILNLQGLIKLIRLKKANGVELMGDYVELDNVRIFGMKYLGSSTTSEIPKIAKEIKQISAAQGEKYTILMMHFGMEGQKGQDTSGDIPNSSVIPLKDAVNYLALGHYHTNYELDGWVFNPGSVEMISMYEYDQPKGFYHVRDNGAKLITPITRPVRRIRLDMSGVATPDELYSKVYSKIESERTLQQDALVELILHGDMGFPKSNVNLERIKDMVTKQFKPLWSDVKIMRSNSKYAVNAGDLRGLTREQIERFVFSDMVKNDSRYRDHEEEIVKNIIDIKKKVCAEFEPADIQKELRWGFEKIKSKGIGNDYKAEVAQQTLLSHIGDS
jgi:DNA repair exonuclease SbcCD nuclease subunit